jgi:malate dehydrogenase
VTLVELAIIGATGSCGRQVAAQVAERGILPEIATMHLIGHAGGEHASELWGLRADLRDAFADTAPSIEVGTDVAATNADLVVMMAGATVSRTESSRAALARKNLQIFSEVAEGIGRMSRPPIVVVQSNPVELAVQMLGQEVPRHQILGAAAWSDSLRFRRELAADFGVRRPMVDAQMWGQHGDHLVPIYSRIHVRGVETQFIADVVGAMREGRSLVDLPAEISETRTRSLAMVHDGLIEEAYAFIQSQPADIRCAVKPFFTHFTAGRTTELATAHAVTDIVEFIVRAQRRVIPAQVPLAGEHWGIDVPLAVPVLLDPLGWSQVVNEPLAADELAALKAAAEAVRATSV